MAKPLTQLEKDQLLEIFDNYDHQDLADYILANVPVDLLRSDLDFMTEGSNL